MAASLISGCLFTSEEAGSAGNTTTNNAMSAPAEMGTNNATPDDMHGGTSNNSTGANNTGSTGMDPMDMGIDMKPKQDMPPEEDMKDPPPAPNCENACSNLATRCTDAFASYSKQECIQACNSQSGLSFNDEKTLTCLIKAMSCGEAEGCYDPAADPAPNLTCVVDCHNLAQCLGGKANECYKECERGNPANDTYACLAEVDDCQNTHNYQRNNGQGCANDEKCLAGPFGGECRKKCGSNRKCTALSADACNQKLGTCEANCSPDTPAGGMCGQPGQCQKLEDGSTVLGYCRVACGDTVLSDKRRRDIHPSLRCVTGDNESYCAEIGSD